MSAVSYLNPIFENYSNNHNMNYESESKLYRNSILIAREASPQDEITFNATTDQNRILEFANVLSQIDFFNREFYMIMSIQKISDYILKKHDLTDNGLDFLISITKSFFKVFDFKINNFDKIDKDSNIKKEYKKFSRIFLKQQNYFYKEIYENTCDEKFVRDITKVLSR